MAQQTGNTASRIAQTAEYLTDAEVRESEAWIREQYRIGALSVAEIRQVEDALPCWSWV